MIFHMLVVCMNIKMGGYDSKFKWKNAYVKIPMRIQTYSVGLVGAGVAAMHHTLAHTEIMYGNMRRKILPN